MEARFDEAYRRHLEWHRQVKDPLPWYGWYVTTGERLGVFIDGSFGIRFAAFDQRVDPAADGADFAQTAGEFAEALCRSVYRVRPELSTAQPLEHHAPSASIEVTQVLVRPAGQQEFEHTLALLREAMSAAEKPPSYTWYQLVAGGEQPSYLLMVARGRWADYDTSPVAGIDLLAGALIEEDRRGEILTAIERSVMRTSSETWTYRPDMSLVPAR